MFHRLATLSDQSFFLFGARQTGKSTWVREILRDTGSLWIDLLDPDTESSLRRNPKELENRISACKKRPEWVVIDEVQKLPGLLDSVHRLIESESLRFVLTGSSARKLMRGRANLLAGRALVRPMHPLTHREMGDAFDLNGVLRWGSLPKTWNLAPAGRNEFLKAYALTFVKEEIAAEQIVRRLDPFRNFLEVAAQGNGTLINFTNIARDVGADPKTVQSFYQILEDTLIGFTLQPWHRSLRKQQNQAPKFFFFDLGVKRALERMLEVPLAPRTYGYETAFEHFVIAEIRRLADYAGRDWRMFHLRTNHGAEIDLVIDRPGAPTLFIEIKSSDRVDERDTRSLEAFLPSAPQGTEAVLLSQCETEKKIGSVLCLPWRRGLQEIGL